MTAGLYAGAVVVKARAYLAKLAPHVYGREAAQIIRSLLTVIDELTDEHALALGRQAVAMEAVTAERDALAKALRELVAVRDLLGRATGYSGLVNTATQADVLAEMEAKNSAWREAMEREPEAYRAARAALEALPRLPE